MTFEEIEELAYIHACELVGPNALEFDALLEHITEEMMRDLPEDFYTGEAGEPVIACRVHIVPAL